MNIPPPSAQKSKIGMCPHGLPQGACPICNGMGGGSSKFQKQTEAIQARMISQYRLQVNLGTNAYKMNNLVTALTHFSQNAQANPSMISKFLLFGAKSVISIINGLNNINFLANRIRNSIKDGLTDISDKLNAIFGELKNSTEKKISDRLKDFKKKFKSIFGIFESDDLENEEKKIEEEKRLFELKTVLNSIKKKIFKNKELNDDASR